MFNEFVKVLFDNLEKRVFVKGVLVRRLNEFIVGSLLSLRWGFGYVLMSNGFEKGSSSMYK